MVKKTKPAKTAKKTAAKPAAKDNHFTIAAATKHAGYPDFRLPVDEDSELLCKRSAKDKQYRCREVPIGGDW
jgi:hypothetical protein